MNIDNNNNNKKALLEQAKIQNEREKALVGLLSEGKIEALPLLHCNQPKKISKETFTDAVKDVMETFDLSLEKAELEAFKDFAMMG